MFIELGTRSNGGGRPSRVCVRESFPSTMLWQGYVCGCVGVVARVLVIVPECCAPDGWFESIGSGVWGIFCGWGVC